jgi:hypothetical protein
MVFNYTASSTTAGTSFGWTRAAVPGISNVAASGTGNISETLINSTSSSIPVTYVYTLAAGGCTNTQNLVVTVNPAATVNCVINGAITTNFNSTSIPAGRYIWFNSVFDRGNFSGASGTVTFRVTNSVITFTANGQPYTLTVPDSRIQFDASVTSASTRFINNTWETVIPRSYSGNVFMGGLAYQVPVNLPGSIQNLRWTARISIDKTNISLAWRWSAAVYTSFAPHSGLNIKPKNGSTQNPYPNNNNAGTPENYKSFLVAGAKGGGGTNYTGSYSSASTATCSTTAQRTVTIAPAILNEEFDVIASPNPSNGSFNLVIRGDISKPVSLRITDMLGRLIVHYDKLPANNVLQIGHSYTAGTYFAEAWQGGQRKFIKMIKVN